MTTEAGALLGMQVGSMLEEDQENQMKGVVQVITADYKEIWEEGLVLMGVKQVLNHLEEEDVWIQEKGTLEV